MSAHESHGLETVLSDQTRQVPASHAAKKVLFVSRTDDYGGAEIHLLELIRRFREPEFQLSIVCLGRDFFSERLDPSHSVQVIKWDKLPNSLRNWVRFFRALQPDVVVFVYGWLWAFPRMASVGAWAAGIHRRVSIQHLVPSAQGEFPWELAVESEQKESIRSTLNRLIRPIALRVSAHFFQSTICVSQAMKKALITDFGFPVKKIRMIHNGVSPAEFFPSASNRSRMRAQLGFLPDEFVLVCVARLSEQKAIGVLLQAVAKVLHDGVECKCIIVGDGPLRGQLENQAQELDLSRAVFFEGFQKDIRSYLQAGSAFILTSRTEGLPLSILEAMACGLPCIVTDVGGNAEAVSHQVNGLVIPAGSPEATAEAISYLATHPQECARMSKMARERASEAFDIENSMAEIKRVILN